MPQQVVASQTIMSKWFDLWSQGYGTNWWTTDLTYGSRAISINHESWFMISSFCVEIYTHPRISQRDFPVIRFVKRKSTETKDKITSWQAHEWADRLTTRQGMRDKKKRNGKSEKKKMWVHHVCKWECRRRVRHSKRLSEKNATSSKKASPESLVRESFS